MAPPPSSDPPPGMEGFDEDHPHLVDDDDSDDIVTRLHVMPAKGEMGPYPGVIVAGKYLLKKQIARGGMGSVWRALDIGLERPVAIKFMDPRIAEDEDLRKRFGREAKAAARLRTPHVVQIYEAGIEAGLPFIAMELLEGEDLHARLKREGPLPVPELAEIVMQIARGLRSAQDAKVVHRDLKPQNIFLSKEGGGLLVKILDFGVAKIRAAADKGDETKAGTVLGSPHYMSPEQARGRPDIDHRADVWSLGVIAFRALTGKMAFPGDAPGEVILKICTDPIPIPTKYRADLPKAFDEVFAKVLERDPEMRYSSSLEFAEALQRVARLAAPDLTPGRPIQPHQAAVSYGVAPSGAVPQPGGLGAPMAGAVAAGALADRAHLHRPAAGIPATSQQAVPQLMPEGTPASAIQALASGIPPGGTPASSVQALAPPTDGTPSSSVQAMTPLPDPAAGVRRGGSAAPGAPGAPPGTALDHATEGGPLPSGTPPGTPLPGTPPGTPMPGTPLPTSQPGTPQPQSAQEQPPPSSDWGLPAPGAVPTPAVSDSGDSWPQSAAARADDSGQYAAAGALPYGAQPLGSDGAPVPHIGGAVAPSPEYFLDDEEVQLPKRGLSIVGGVAAGAAVLVLIACVLLLGRPDETAAEPSDAPIPSTLLEDMPPAAPDEPSLPPPPVTSDVEEPSGAPATTATGGGAGAAPSATSSDTTSSTKTKKKRPRRPYRPGGTRPSDEWGY